MELRDLATSILFGTVLSDKLFSPSDVTDLNPGSPIPSPKSPGRPETLVFKSQIASPNQLPSFRDLEKHTERGRLLHFFANHELLATELMALVLLRFPDAPPCFRRGVWQTLQDEQRHTQLYIQALNECGVEFGDFPVSGFFWRSVSTMDHPMDYVAALSLTFEQANLDFSTHFARVFSSLGDLSTASLLNGIYRDEIAHVAYGLKWFRRWKSPSESDWDAFCRVLRFPLSPRRAKGFHLNVAARQSAGFDSDFITNLTAFERSKGRNPFVWFFNPFPEGHIGQGSAFNPNASQVLLRKDLESLPQYLCSRDDVVLLNQSPRVAFLNQLSECGFLLPEFQLVHQSAARQTGACPHHRLAGYKPWAWSPDALEQILSFESRRPLEQQQTWPNLPYSQAIGDLFSKAWSAAFLRGLLAECNELYQPAIHRLLCDSSNVGTVCASTACVLSEVDRIRSMGHHRVVLKKVFGLAGQGALRLWEEFVSEAQIRWIDRETTAGRTLIVEPWLDRAFDFSAQYHMVGGKLNCVGYTRLQNDHRGQYQANFAAPNFLRHPPKEIQMWLRSPGFHPGLLQLLFELIRQRLESRLKTLGFSGAIGIDSFVYRNSSGEFRIKPIVEINPRFTMGRVLVELMRCVCPGGHGAFELVTVPMIRRAGFSDFAAYDQFLTARFPIRMEGTPLARIKEGSTCLTDPTRAQSVVATFHVRTNAVELPLDSVALP